MTSIKVTLAAQEYSHNYAWTNHFGGGLSYDCGNPFAGLSPGSVEYFRATLELQQAAGLTVDGMFGPASLKAYSYRHGPPNMAAFGADVSGWQLGDDGLVEPEDDHNEIHFDRLAAVGRGDFAYIKLVQGVGSRTRRSSAHFKSAELAGVPAGPYAFLTPFTGGIHDAEREADKYISLIDSELPEHQLRAAIDLEDKGYKRNKKTGEVTRGADLYKLWKEDRPAYRVKMTEWLVKYLERFRRLYGDYPLLYSYPSYLNKRILPLGEIQACPLWLAAYTLNEPTHQYGLDPGWRLAVQQYTSSGDDASRSVFAHDLDLNRAPWGLERLLRA